MSWLGELIVQGVFGGVGEAIADLSPSVRNTLTGVVGLCLAGAVGATLGLWPAAEDRPAWTIGLTVASLIFGLVLGVVSTLTVAHDRDDRGFAVFALFGCLAAAAVPMVMMISMA